MKMETDKRSASIFSLSREMAGLSQEYIALEMEVSRKTVWSWENGFSYPSMKQLFEWFKILNENPYPYLYSYLQILTFQKDVTM